jgi:hypothetical protein
MGGRQRSRRCPTLQTHACTVGHLCTHWRAISARRCPPAHRLLALWSFPTTCGIPPPVLVAAIGLQLVSVVVVVPIARVAVSGAPDVGVGAFGLPASCACCCTAFSTPNHIRWVGTVCGGSFLPPGSPRGAVQAPWVCSCTCLAGAPPVRFRCEGT